MGNTHEDVGGTYGIISLGLKCIYIIEMMDTNWVFEENQAFPPTLIDKVYEFKSFLNGYIKEEKNALFGHPNV